MDFIEESTPRGYRLKIFYNKQQFMVFNKKGQSVYVDESQGSLLHRIPMIIFVGKSFSIRKSYTNEYSLVKIREDNMIIPYIDNNLKKTRYLFVPIQKEFDVVPVILKYSESIPSMVKQYDSNTRPDHVIVDHKITANDIIIIKNRYQVDDVIKVEKEEEPVVHHDDDKTFNINVMSSNPVFLAKIHINNMEFSKIKQLLFDFELTALDTDYILKYLNDILYDQELYMIPKNRVILEGLRDSFRFYQHLLRKSDEDIDSIIQAADSVKKLDILRTLVSKVKSLHPGHQEQDKYTEYEDKIIQKSEAIKSA